MNNEDYIKKKKKRHVHISVFSVLLFLGGAFTKGLNGVMVFTADGQFLFVRVKSKVFTLNFSLRLTVINLSIFKHTNLGTPFTPWKIWKTNQVEDVKLFCNASVRFGGNVAQQSQLCF